MSDPVYDYYPVYKHGTFLRVGEQNTVPQLNHRSVMVVSTADGVTASRVMVQDVLHGKCGVLNKSDLNPWSPVIGDLVTFKKGVDDRQRSGSAISPLTGQWVRYTLAEDFRFTLDDVGFSNVSANLRDHVSPGSGGFLTSIANIEPAFNSRTSSGPTTEGGITWNTKREPTPVNNEEPKKFQPGQIVSIGRDTPEENRTFLYVGTTPYRAGKRFRLQAGSNVEFVSLEDGMVTFEPFGFGGRYKIDERHVSDKQYCGAYYEWVKTETQETPPSPYGFKVGDRVYVKPETPLEARTFVSDQPDSQGVKFVLVGTYQMTVDKIDGDQIFMKTDAQKPIRMDAKYLAIRDGHKWGSVRRLDQLTSQELASMTKSSTKPEFKAGDHLFIKEGTPDEVRTLVSNAKGSEGKRFMLSGTYNIFADKVEDGFVHFGSSCYGIQKFPCEHLEPLTKDIPAGTFTWLDKEEVPAPTRLQFKKGEFVYIKEGTPEDARTFELSEQYGDHPTGSKLILAEGSGLISARHEDGYVWVALSVKSKCGGWIREEYVTSVAPAIANGDSVWRHPETTEPQEPILKTVAFREPPKSEPVTTRKPKSPIPRKWEYKIVKLVGQTSGVESTFNNLGQDGWNLVKVEDASAYFKRPLRPSKTQSSAVTPVKDNLVLDCPTEVYLQLQRRGFSHGWFNADTKKFDVPISIFTNKTTLDELRENKVAIFLTREAATAVGGSATFWYRVDPKTGVIGQSDCFI